MLLAIDIGNTTIALGLLRGLKVVKVFRVETQLPRNKMTVQLKRILTGLKRKYPSLKTAVICSVVPDVLGALKSIVAQELKTKVLVIGQDLHVPLINRYRNPQQVGQDRLVGGYVAMTFYGAPTIIIDFGTAITFDVVSKKREYLGGIIVPGLRLSAESLFHKTALLPKIKIISPKELIGRDTQNSILSGLFYGYGAMCRGLVHLISKKIKGKPTVVITGGHTALMKKYIAQDIQVVDEDLVLKGVALIYKKCR